MHQGCRRATTPALLVARSNHHAKRFGRWKLGFRRVVLRPLGTTRPWGEGRVCAVAVGASRPLETLLRASAPSRWRERRETACRRAPGGTPRGPASCLAPAGSGRRQNQSRRPRLHTATRDVPPTTRRGPSFDAGRSRGVPRATAGVQNAPATVSPPAGGQARAPATDGQGGHGQGRYVGAPALEAHAA